MHLQRGNLIFLKMYISQHFDACVLKRILADKWCQVLQCGPCTDQHQITQLPCWEDQASNQKMQCRIIKMGKGYQKQHMWGGIWWLVRLVNKTRRPCMCPCWQDFWWTKMLRGLSHVPPTLGQIGWRWQACFWLQCHFAVAHMSVAVCGSSAPGTLKARHGICWWSHQHKSNYTRVDISKANHANLKMTSGWWLQMSHDRILGTAILHLSCPVEADQYS